MEKERERAAEMNYPYSNTTMKEATDDNLIAAIDFVIETSNQKFLHFLVTHNEKSNRISS